MVGHVFNVQSIKVARFDDENRKRFKINGLMQWANVRRKSRGLLFSINHKNRKNRQTKDVFNVQGIKVSAPCRFWILDFGFVRTSTLPDGRLSASEA